MSTTRHTGEAQAMYASVQTAHISECFSTAVNSYLTTLVEDG